MSNIFSQENNKENWEQLAFVLQERDKPTFIVIGFDSYATQKTIFRELKNEFSNYKFYELDLSSLSIVSLNQVFISKLPKTIVNSKPSEYIVNVFGLENSLFTVQNKNIEQSSLIAELNFEREMLFQRFPFITIVWTDSYTVGKLKKEAKDLWDWISYYFEFKSEKEADNDTINIKTGGDVFFAKDQAIVNVKYSQDNQLPKTKIFISYVREDYKIAKKLYGHLKTLGFKPWTEETDVLAGQNWKLAISNAIKESDYFLALISSHSLTKGNYIHKEIKIALEILNELPSDSIFFIPVYLDQCEPLDDKLRDIQGVNLFPSYEEGLKKILYSLGYAKNIEKINSNSIIKLDDLLSEKEIQERINLQKFLRQGYKEIINNFPLHKEHRAEKEYTTETKKIIRRLQERYDLIKLDDTSRERVINEKINIQKLLGQKYVEVEDYEKAEQSFRIALALCEQTDGLEYEKDEISFLLRQIHYQPIKNTAE